MEERSLKQTFPRLYQLALNKTIFIANKFDFVNGVFSWKWLWRRPLFSWEEEQLPNLNALLSTSVF